MLHDQFVQANLPILVPGFLVETACFITTDKVKASALVLSCDLDTAGHTTMPVSVHRMNTSLVGKCNESVAGVASQVVATRVVVPVAGPRDTIEGSRRHTVDIEGSEVVKETPTEGHT